VLRRAKRAHGAGANTPYLETALPANALRERLRAVEPWRHEIHFSNGVSTAEFAQGRLFNSDAWSKVRRFERHVPFPRGGQALDVGCNSGYNAAYLAQRHRMSGLGIDVVPGHIEASRAVAEAAGLEGFEFSLEDANTFSRPGCFDLILHLGTLYHLEHPVLALERSFENLVPGGWLCLETQCYGDGDECMYIRNMYSDRTNWFALGPGALTDILEGVGFSEVAEVNSWSDERFEKQRMSRRSYMARRPAVASSSAEGTAAS
jgi:SAM-dependent methyltransferase